MHFSQLPEAVFVCLWERDAMKRTRESWRQPQTFSTDPASQRLCLCARGEERQGEAAENWPGWFPRPALAARHRSLFRKRALTHAADPERRTSLCRSHLPDPGTHGCSTAEHRVLRPLMAQLSRCETPLTDPSPSAFPFNDRLGDPTIKKEKKLISCESDGLLSSPWNPGLSRLPWNKGARY